MSNAQLQCHKIASSDVDNVFAKWMDLDFLPQSLSLVPPRACLMKFSHVKN